METTIFSLTQFLRCCNSSIITYKYGDLRIIRKNVTKRQLTCQGTDVIHSRQIFSSNLGCTHCIDILFENLLLVGEFELLPNGEIGDGVVGLLGIEVGLEGEEIEESEVTVERGLGGEVVGVASAESREFEAPNGTILAGLCLFEKEDELS